MFILQVLAIGTASTGCTERDRDRATTNWTTRHPLTTVAYIGGPVVEAFVEHFAVGEPIPQMPLFLTRENYVRVPLEATCMAAWEDVPSQYQEALGARFMKQRKVG